MVQKIILDTDYHDYYDYWFLTPSSGYKDTPIFSRKVSSGLHRLEQFKVMKNLGYSVIDNWPRVDDACLQLQDKIVVYTDPMQHGGEGKVLVTLEEGLGLYPSLPCSKYIETKETGSMSLRHLFIGNYRASLLYINPGDWRTNWVTDNEVTIKLTSIDMWQRDPKKELPLVAIDFVSDTKKDYAIDYNTAPGLKGQEIDKILDATWVAEQIGDFINAAT